MYGKQGCLSGKFRKANQEDIDTNVRNTAARALYRKLGYKEIAIVPTTFNGIPGFNLVLLEKNLNAFWPACRIPSSWIAV